MKNTRLNLIYIALAVLTFLTFSFYPEDSEKKESVVASPPAVSDDTSKPLATDMPAEVAESYEERDVPVVISHDEKPARVLEKSKLGQRCLTKLETATKRINDGTISSNIQREISSVFNTCVYEIEIELVLTEKEFNDSENDAHCLNSVSEIRDYLLDLGVKAQAFSELPNATEYDRANIAALFSRVSDDIFTRADLAMKNRTVTCLQDSQQLAR